MSIEACYAALPDRLYLFFDGEGGFCLDIDDHEQFSAVIPCIIIRRDRNGLTITTPVGALDAGLLIDRGCIVIGRNMMIRRSAIITDLTHYGPSSVITVKFS